MRITWHPHSHLCYWTGLMFARIVSLAHKTIWFFCWIVTENICLEMWNRLTWNMTWHIPLLRQATVVISYITHISSKINAGSCRCPEKTSNCQTHQPFLAELLKASCQRRPRFDPAFEARLCSSEISWQLFWQTHLSAVQWLLNVL